MLDKTISFRVTKEICTTFFKKNGDILVPFLRACLEWACDASSDEIRRIMTHEY